MQIDRPIAIALILFVILLLAFFLVIPEYNTFTQLQTQLSEKTAEYNAQHDYYSAIDKTYQNLQGRQDDVSKIDDALPQDPDLGRLVYFIQQTAEENGMIVKDLFLSQASSGLGDSNVSSKVKNMVFSMDVLGDYGALSKFIISLEKSSRLFEVTSISFSSPAGSLPSSQSQFQIEQTYSFSLQIKTQSY